MNKNLYRVVFSRARGLFVVVAERVTGQHKTSAQSPATGPGRRVVTLRPIGLALLAAFGGIAPVHGQIVADPGAPKNQQPTIVNSANGTPQVNIRTPSAAGVSRNTYSQFDVNQQGAILNNARTSAQTQLGGWVQANPWLARGTAKVILNEVNGSHPSQLRGYIEVAGDRAQVVIANPAGISCDGCGFINANRATLTTGQPILNGGHLDGYRVQQGVINIGGAGLDASKTDFTDIIARAVNVNAGIWASTLKVSAGANQVDAAHEQVQATATTGTAPGYAIDVASLGGMYAGKILLVGTEHGVGVRNAGEIGAGVGDVTLTAAGMLENRGRITAAGTVGVDSDAGIVNHGTVYAQGDSRLGTRGDIDNRGSLASVGNTTLIAAGAGSRIDNRRGALLAAGLGADGRVGSSGALQLNASGQIAAAGQQLAAGRLALEGSDVDLAGSQTHGGSVALTARSGDLDASGATLSARQTLDARATGLLRSDRASVSAGQLTLAAYQQSNRGGELLQLGTGIASLTVTDRFDNTGGTVASNGGITLQASQLLNRDGLIQAAGEGGLSLGIAGHADNQNGRIRAAQRLELAATGITNRNGVLAGADIHLDSRQQQFDNGNGIVAARGTLDLDSGRLDNAAGTLQADGALRINTHGQTLSNTGSGSQGGILGQHDVRLDTGELDNRSGFIGAVGDLAISADQVDNHASLLRAGGDVTVSAASIRNADTLGSDQGIEGRSVSINAHDIDNRAGAMRADQALTLTGAGHLDNQNGLLSSGQTVAVRDQSQGPRSQTVSNDGGILIAGRQLSIDSAGLDGNGKLLSQGDLSLSLSGDYTQTGTLQAAGNATLTFGGTLSNQARLEAGSTLTVSAANLDNRASGSLRGDRTRLSVSDTLNNRGLIDGRETLLQADTVANIGSGRIYGDQLSIATTTLRNDTENGASASVAARDRLDLGVHTLINREHALLFSAGDLAIGGALGSDGRVTGAADHVGNHSASIEALNGLSLNAFRVENSNEHFRIEEQQVGGPTRITEYQGSGAIARYLAGTPGVYPFKDESWQLRTPEGRYEGWLQYDYTRTIKETKIVESDPGRITAGGNLVLNADSVLNSNSRIMAGGALQASVRDLNNTEVVGKQTITESGTVTSYWRHHKSGTDGTKSDVDNYNPAT